MPTLTAYSVKDADVQSTAGTLNASTSSPVNVGYSSYVGSYFHGLFQVDVSSISGAVISAVTQAFWWSGTTTNTIVGRKISSSWVETDSTTAPTIDSSASTAGLGRGTGSYQTSTDSLWVTWTQGWVNGTITNNGYAAVCTTTTDSTGSIYTREQTGTTNDPYLSITYSYPTDAPPISDTYVGGWVSAPLYAKLDETVADDADYISSSGGTCTLALGTITDPGTSSAQISFRGRIRGNDTKNLSVVLKQSGTLIVQWDYPNNPPGTWIQVDQVLTAGQQAAITDWSALTIDLIVT